MLVVDVNTCFGASAAERTDLSLSTLLEALDRHQVGLAFTHSLRGVRYAYEQGNAETQRATRAHPQLLPAATVDLRRYMASEAEVERCLEQGIRLFRFFPEVQGWRVSDSCFAALAARLAGVEAAVMVSAAAAPAAMVGQILAQYGVPAILTEVGYSNMAEVMASMRRFPDLYAETSGLATPGAIDVMAGEVGAARLLYGSGAPRHSIQRALNQICEAAVPEQEKASILGGNAMRLFALGAEQRSGRAQLSSPEIARFAEPVIDVHCHLGRWEFPIPAERATDLVRLMQQAGVERAIASSAEAIIYDLAAGNRWLAGEIAPYPELLGYVVVNPNEFDLSCQEMDRYYQRPNFVGAKLHSDYAGVPTSAEKTRRLLHEVARRGKPLKIHVAGGGALPSLQEIALAYPEWAIIKAHGGDGPAAQEVAGAPNIYFEFASSRCSSHTIREALEVLGADRLMFGSDATLLSMCSMLGAYHDADLTAEEREKVLSRNARRVFRL